LKHSLGARALIGDRPESGTARRVVPSREPMRNIVLAS
jgi:hypothetical protein